MWLSRSSFFSPIAVLASAILFQHAVAQVTTDCQPLNTTNCPSDPALGMDYNFHFNQTPVDGTWETTVGPVLYDETNGATFTINKHGDSPTIRSKFYIFFGRVEVWMKVASGTGIISSVMMLSDDLDEIDWEFMGGNSTHAETNYFGKGRQDYHNAIYYPVNGGVQADYHNYTTHWTKDGLRFYIDNTLVRTLLPKDANNTNNYPQTPMRVSMGIWAGGDPSLPEGTRQWAGGDTDFSKGPFTMYVKSAQITDYSQGKEYSYGDMSGSWQSIRVTAGNSTAHEKITAPPPETLADKWRKLPSTAKIAIYASAAGVGAVLLACILFYCIRQRRRGAQEAKLAEARYQEERRELAAYKAAGIDPDSLVPQSEYDAKDMRNGGLANKEDYAVPPSPASTFHAGQEKLGATNAGVSGPQSPMPLLREGAQSPRVTSPGPFRENVNSNPAFDRSLGGGGSAYPLSPLDRIASPAGLISPVRSASPGYHSPSEQPLPRQALRSFSTPNTDMRVGSPGPHSGDGYGMSSAQRAQSPAHMAVPQPQRSFTTGGYGSPAVSGPGYGAGGHGGFGNGGNGEGYWGTGGYR